MIVTTTNRADGYEVEEFIGIVSGEGVFGANVFRDMFAAVRNIVGGRSRGYEKELEEARMHALKKMAEKADKCGANAVLGISLDTEFIGMPKGGMMMVTATGTAVRLKKVAPGAGTRPSDPYREEARAAERGEGDEQGKGEESTPPWYTGGLFEQS